MFLQAVPDALQSNLESLGKLEKIKQFHLAGGTALALQLGHRVSRDLDFFTPQKFSEKMIMAELEKLGELKIDTLAEETILGTLNGIKISFFFYRYTLIFPAVPFLGVDLADYREIGAMKLDAVQSRGKKRDFVDLWAIFQKGIILGDLLSYFQKKYAGVAYNTQHLLKSLTYFADAEEDEMPQMLVKVSWEEIKDFMENSVKDFVSAGLKW